MRSKMNVKQPRNQRQHKDRCRYDRARQRARQSEQSAGVFTGERWDQLDL